MERNGISNDLKQKILCMKDFFIKCKEKNVKKNKIAIIFALCYSEKIKLIGYTPEKILKRATELLETKTGDEVYTEILNIAKGKVKIPEIEEQATENSVPATDNNQI